MSDTNPFAKLQRLFDKNTPSPDAPKESSSAPSTNPAKGFASSSSPKHKHSHDADSELFLHTVNALPKTSRPEQGTGENSMFKQAMQAAGIAPMDKKKHKKRSKTTPLSPPPVGQADNKKTPSAPQPANLKDADTPAQANGQDSLEVQEADLFIRAMTAMSDVTPVNKRGRDVHSPAEAKTPPRPAGKTPAEIMQEILDGRIEFAIQHTGEYMEGFVQGVSPEVLDKLRLGQFSPEAHIDLHGLNALQAYTELVRFIKNCYQRNIRTVTVITGRGKNSPDGVAVLRNLIQEWLTRDPFKRVVLAFCSAQPRDGGAGALYVLLRKYKKSIGKIQWELPYSGPDADL